MKLHVQILVGMIVGLLAGLLAGPQGVLWQDDRLDALDGSLEILTYPAAEAPVLGASARGTARLLPEGPAGFHRVLVDLNPEVATVGFVPVSPGVVTSATSGHQIVAWTEWIGRLFLALIKMVVVPLVFLSLVGGVASIGDVRTLGRLGIRTLVYFTSTTAVAIAIGVGLTVLVRPGAWVPAADREQLLVMYASEATKRVADAGKVPTLVDQLVGLIPVNPIESLARGDMLQIIVFAVLLGVALTWLPAGRSAPVLEVFDRLNEAMVGLVHLAMALAPIGVATLLFKLAGSTGSTVLVALAGYVLVVLIGLLLHVALVYAPVIQWGARIPLRLFFGGMREALLLAFSTSSSSAALPVTKANAEENLGISPKITSFVLPLGATVNMDGTALYQGVAAVFIAQLLGVDLSWMDLLTVVGSATLASIGAAGVPGAGMITLVMVLTAIGVPAEGLALILGVDRLLDMFRTAVNVTGDVAAAGWMARLEAVRPTP